MNNPQPCPPHRTLAGLRQIAPTGFAADRPCTSLGALAGTVGGIFAVACVDACTTHVGGGGSRCQGHPGMAPGGSTAGGIDHGWNGRPPRRAACWRFAGTL